MKARTSTMEKETLQVFFKALLKNRLLLAGSIVYFVGVIGIYVAMPLFISQTLAGIVTQTAGVDTYFPSLVIAAAIGIGANIIGFISIVRLDAKTQKVLLGQAAETLLARSVGFHANNIGGKLVSNMLDYPGAFSRLLNVAYINLVPFILIMVIGITVVLSRSLPIGLALLALTITTLTLVLLESRRRSGLRVQRKHAQEAMIANISDAIVNSQAVKTFAHERVELAKHAKLDGKLMDFRLRDWTGTGLIGSIRMAILLTLQIAFIAYMARIVQQDQSVLGVGIFAFAYTLSLTAKLFEVGVMIRHIEEAFLQASPMTKIIMQQQEIVDAPNAKELVVSRGEITLKNIAFAYSDAKDKQVFSHLALTIPAGQKVGVVGHSGGGKSTLTRLLLRFDDVTNGKIEIDGQDIATVTQESLRKSIAYVPQEPLLFHRSVLENIAYGRPDATEAEIKRAAKLAYATEFIETLPAKYDTIVGERGVKLSGGQRQRIAIARAILKDAPILILDEATSALDSESEVYIQRALAQLMKNRTTIVVAHRLSTIQKMDRIIVLDHGKVVEDGSHKALQKQSGIYASLWSHQSGGFIEE